MRYLEWLKWCIAVCVRCVRSTIQRFSITIKRTETKFSKRQNENVQKILTDTYKKDLSLSLPLSTYSTINSTCVCVFKCEFGNRTRLSIRQRVLSFSCSVPLYFTHTHTHTRTPSIDKTLRCVGFER